jgi:hypothetical protein
MLINDPKRISRVAAIMTHAPIFLNVDPVSKCWSHVWKSVIDGLPPKPFPSISTAPITRKVKTM